MDLSEITHAEVKFKNGPSPTEHKALSETKTLPTGFQKPITCFLKIMIGILLLRSVVLGVVLYVFSQGSSEKELLKLQPQNATDWTCLLKSLEGKKQELSCCMKGWERHGSSCYYFSQDAANWVNSRLKCTQMGSDLVVINSEAEQDFLNAHSDKDKGYWIGLRDPEQQNKWQWVDDTPLNNRVTFWRQGEPSDLQEDCSLMHVLKDMYTNSKKNWNDLKCTERSNYICEAMAIIFF